MKEILFFFAFSPGCSQDITARKVCCYLGKISFNEKEDPPFYTHTVSSLRMLQMLVSFTRLKIMVLCLNTHPYSQPHYSGNFLSKNSSSSHFYAGANDRWASNSELDLQWNQRKCLPKTAVCAFLHSKWSWRIVTHTCQTPPFWIMHIFSRLFLKGKFITQFFIFSRDLHDPF